MPNTFDENGLTVKTVDEIRTDLEDGFKAAYGDDINVEQNSPDGQMIGVMAQTAADILELLVQVYQSMSIEAAFGKTLDQRVALNGLLRKGGNYTQTPIVITVDRALSLTGLASVWDAPTAATYTLRDTDGKLWYLIGDQASVGAGTINATLRSAEVGAVDVLPNTITSQETPILGVTAVNNPTITGTQTGTAEESDGDLRVRHGRMFYLASIGPAEAVQAAVLAVPEVIDCLVLENHTAAPVDGVPAYGIWVIVNQGAATDEDVGTSIYRKKSPGCDMEGAVTYDIVRTVAGVPYTVVTIQWDLAVVEDLYVQFGLVPLDGAATYDADVVKAALAAALTYKLGQSPNIGDVVNAMRTILPNFYLTTPGVGDDGMAYSDSISPDAFTKYFVLDVANITIL